ncbi:MAG: formylmethanofuran dehydrogenase [Methylotenera sp.]|nr:formylmethanofuran dehydrogenase [Methylotenera sp.]
MKTISNTTVFEACCCPACGLLCDDIIYAEKSPITTKNACLKSISFFEKSFSGNSISPQVAGKPTDLNVAIQAAADILCKSNQPLFAGLGTEVQGMRALMRLAEKTSATLDHIHSEGTVRNTLAMQNSGWQNTTLTEVKNRADVILAIGTDIVSSHPRFFEKVVWNTDSLFNKPTPEVIYLGVAADNTKSGISPNGKFPLVIPAETAKLPEIINALNALMSNKNPFIKKSGAELVGGVAISALTLILDKLKAAQYAVVVWSAGNLKFAHAELTVQSITQLIAKLNEANRVTGLPLNSGDGDSSVNNTSTWLSGYPTRNRFINGHAEYDAYHFSSKNQLSNCDALLWISTLSAHQPPDCDATSIVIGHPNMQFDKIPDVFIPVGIPGVDHSGTMFRMDSSVAMPLKKLRETHLPSLSEIIGQIEAKIS